ncbi:MAG: membrane protein insertase YidC [Endomicrobiia bacterium]
MERRLILAILLSLGFLFLWQYVFYKPQIEKDISQPINKKEVEKKLPENLFSFVPLNVETKYLRIIFNKHTAAIREVYLKEPHKEDFILLCKEDKDIFGHQLNDGYYYNKAETFKQNNTLVVRFESKEKNIRCSYYIDDNKPYFVDVEINRNSSESIKVFFEGYIHSDEDIKEPNIGYICKTQPTASKEVLVVEKINKGKFYKQDKLKWVALSSRYFISTVIFENNYLEEIEINKVDKNKKRLLVVTSPTANYKIKLFLGPKKISLLKTAAEKLIHTVDWGTFAFLSKLFYNILTYFYRLFGNYGLAIIGLTIILQIFTFPLTYNSIKATIKMKHIQPQIQFLQKIYKDDPKRLNMEIMNLYREKKVNPFGGCLPLLLQIPIFWALFTMLRNTYDLRGASFILWIKDLSKPDKLFIPGVNFGIPVLVLLMGISMIVQQILSGSFSDPQQRTISIMMPVIFVFLFFSFPSGLVLYWFINNLFSIAIQLLVVRTTTRV